MREIKFRCWQIVTHDEYDKPIWEMIQAEDLAFEKYEPLVDLLSSDPESEIFMQYTGLKDKNGKEIYEGDVIEIPLFGHAIIIWNDGICAFQYAYHAIGVGTAIGGRMTNTLYKHESEAKYEVIGNIYENPELID